MHEHLGSCFPVLLIFPNNKLLCVCLSMFFIISDFITFWCYSIFQDTTSSRFLMVLILVCLSFEFH